MRRPTRLVQLVHLLAGRRPKTVEEIAGHFEISQRTVYRDLADLSRHDIPITRNEYGYQLLEGATIRPLALTAGERAALKLVLRSPAVRTAPDIGKAIEMVEAKLDAATRQSEETPSALTLAGPERSGAIPAGRTDLLQRAVRERTPVSIHYRSLASRHRSWRGVDPYALFHREAAWYLIGRCHLHDEPRVFRLDRIADVRLLEGRFDRPAFDLDDHLRHTWAVYRGRELHRIVIHFDAALAPLIEEGIHHPGERVGRLENGDLEYRVDLSHLDEIARWILGFAGQARAVEPPALVRLVAEMARLAFERHGDGADEGASAGRGQDELPGLAGEAPARQRPLI